MIPRNYDPNSYEVGFADGFEHCRKQTPLSDSLEDRIDEIVIAEQDEPTPLEVDPDTLNEDERVFYEAGYDHGYEDGVIDSEYVDAAEDDDDTDYIPETDLDLEEAADLEYEQYLRDMREGLDR